ncbi:hypothetical protein DO021_13610 [Desulfobacter hydrogenophilus]|uniref:Alpha/beta hydrolase n=1 Tax=Desulfobacter hydrogenophilus TaxID=2291 RepID=A0A328FER2_9BACT|nr:hypothetical protein [Desulfobacter hydrogenophilus]NDY74360.1 hypothetical protein [Desulfobacter hydrogenophilus]QBH12484.1 hypothetical protein EYB58_05905 [Desulfobacter hydrogenophilus]RAM01517.1 hypothetical protein DO021_13610 [Desulfobacter hydrogenophilus]
MTKKILVSNRHIFYSHTLPGTGTNKKAGKNHTQNTFSVIYIHGFPATRQETTPLSEMVAKQSRVNLFCTRFTAHGHTVNPMLVGSVNAWINDAMDALKIGQQIDKD